MTDQCRPVALPTGETIRARGAEPMTEQDAAALATVVAAACGLIPPPPLEAVELYARLDAVRADRGLSWRELAREAGVRPSVPSRLANGILPGAEDQARLDQWLQSAAGS